MSPVTLTKGQAQRLLTQLCVDQGYCLPASAQAALIQQPPETVTEFTDAVIVAEGLEPYPRMQLGDYRKLTAIVARHFQIAEEERFQQEISLRPTE